jgi:hypothetical protein
MSQLNIDDLMNFEESQNIADYGDWLLINTPKDIDNAFIVDEEDEIDYSLLLSDLSDNLNCYDVVDSIINEIVDKVVASSITDDEESVSDTYVNIPRNSFNEDGSYPDTIEDDNILDTSLNRLFKRRRVMSEISLVDMINFDES